MDTLTGVLLLSGRRPGGANAPDKGRGARAAWSTWSRGAGAQQQQQSIKRKQTNKRGAAAAAALRDAAVRAFVDQQPAPGEGGFIHSFIHSCWKQG